MDDKVFDYGRVDAGITAVCDVMDELGLTMLERWHVAKSIATAAREMIDEGLRAARSQQSSGSK